MIIAYVPHRGGTYVCGGGGGGRQLLVAAAAAAAAVLTAHLCVVALCEGVHEAGAAASWAGPAVDAELVSTRPAQVNMQGHTEGTHQGQCSNTDRACISCFLYKAAVASAL